MDEGLNVLLEKLYHLSQAMHESMQTIHANMEENQPEQIEQFQNWTDQRGKVIASMQQKMTEMDPHWNPEQQTMIRQIQKWESSMQPIMKQLYQSFSGQIQRLQQGKKINQQYHQYGAQLYMDGTYIDKRN